MSEKYDWVPQLDDCPFCGAKVSVEQTDTQHYILTWDRDNVERFYGVLCTQTTTTLVQQICGLYGITSREYHDRVNLQNFQFTDMVHRKLVKWLHSQRPSQKTEEIMALPIKRPF